MKPTKIFYWVMFGIAMIWEAIAILSTYVDTLTHVAHYYFYARPFVVTTLFYILGHMIAGHPWVLKLWISLTIMVVMGFLITITDYFIVHVNPLFIAIWSFSMGVAFWNTGGTWYFAKWKWKKNKE